MLSALEPLSMAARLLLQGQSPYISAFLKDAMLPLLQTKCVTEAIDLDFLIWENFQNVLTQCYHRNRCDHLMYLKWTRRDTL